MALMLAVNSANELLLGSQRTYLGLPRAIRDRWFGVFFAVLASQPCVKHWRIFAVAIYMNKLLGSVV